MSDLAAIRERHVPVTLPKGDNRERTRWQGCDFDEQPWPCDAAQLLALLADTPSVEPPGMDVERLAEGDDDTPSYGDLRDTIWNIIRAVGRSADGRRYEARTVEFDSVINEALGLVACAPVGAPTRWLAAQAAFRIAAGLPEFTEEAAREHRAALHAAEIVDPRDDTWTQASDSPEKP